MGTDVFGRALRDCYHERQTEPLLQFDGDSQQDHPIEQFYFEPFSAEDGEAWIESQPRGPLLDVGAGAGRDTLYFQDRFETTALELSEQLVALMRERGVEDARHGDMFALPAQFDADQFGSALVRGTQLSLAKSMRGLEQFLTDLAAVTTSGATAVVDSYDPTDEQASDLLGYREDATAGLAFRMFAFEYDDAVSEALLFRLFSPARLRNATAETPWTVTELRRSSESAYYLAALEKDAETTGRSG